MNTSYFPEDVDFGCLPSRNLSNHESGLKNRSDAEIKDTGFTSTSTKSVWRPT